MKLFAGIVDYKRFQHGTKRLDIVTVKCDQHINLRIIHIHTILNSFMMRCYGTTDRQQQIMPKNRCTGIKNRQNSDNKFAMVLI